MFADRQLASALLAFLLGWTGAHKFVLGSYRAGAIMAAVSVCTCFVACPFVWTLAIVEGVQYLTRSKEEWEEKYLGKEPRQWF